MRNYASINWEENILKTYNVSLNALWLQKNGPPGQAPRPGLEWKEETHRWVRPRTGGEGGPKRKEPGTILNLEHYLLLILH